jgi:hypothetical protein
LEKNNELPKLEDTIVGRARITKSLNEYLIALTINDHVSLLKVETLRETLCSLPTRYYHGIRIKNGFYIGV